MLEGLHHVAVKHAYRSRPDLHTPQPHHLLTTAMPDAEQLHRQFKVCAALLNICNTLALLLAYCHA